MIQDLTTDTVSRYVDATPEAFYDLVSDITRTHEHTPDVVRCTWLDGATTAVVGARFKAVNNGGRRPNWNNKPVITVADRGREFALSRTEPFCGTVVWRYVLEPEGTGTRVTQSYEVTKKISPVGWFIIGTLYGHKDRASELHDSMLASLDRLAALLARESSTV